MDRCSLIAFVERSLAITGCEDRTDFWGAAARAQMGPAPHWVLGWAGNESAQKYVWQGRYVEMLPGCGMKPSEKMGVEGGEGIHL